MDRRGPPVGDVQWAVTGTVQQGRRTNLEQSEPARERPGRSGPSSWLSKVWNLAIDYGESEGPEAKLGLVVWGFVILALLAVGIYAIAISI